MEGFAARLKALMREARITEGHLMEYAGLSRGQLWKIFTKGQEPKLETLDRIILVFELAGLPPTRVLAWLLGRGEFPPAPRYYTLREASREFGIPLSRLKRAYGEGLLTPRAVPGPKGVPLFPPWEIERAKGRLERERKTREKEPQKAD